MLAARGYQTKKELKAAIGQTFKYTETSMFGEEYKPDGMNAVVGPSATERKWFASVDCKDGKIVKVS